MARRPGSIVLFAAGVTLLCLALPAVVGWAWAGVIVGFMLILLGLVARIDERR